MGNVVPLALRRRDQIEPMRMKVWLWLCRRFLLTDRRMGTSSMSQTLLADVGKRLPQV